MLLLLFDKRALAADSLFIHIMEVHIIINQQILTERITVD